MRFFSALFIILFSVSAYSADSGLNITLPEGFSISVFADGLSGVRSMALGDDGTVFAGNRKGGNVYAVRDTDGDGKADKKYTIASGLNSPNGVAFRKGSLYVAEINRILRFDNITSSLNTPEKPVTVFDKLPDDGWHGWKYIAFGPDGRLYIPVGAPCNTCVRDLPYSALHSIKADGTDFRTEAVGIRNTVGFDWNPETGSLWFTDNGRDMLGDDIPPDELNRIAGQGDNFGFPYCFGDNVPDAEYGGGQNCSGYIKPEVRFRAHVAPLGMKFYTGKMFPEKYRGGIFVAQHGSWNRSSKVGYRVMFVKIENDKAAGHTVFAEGWLNNGKVSGRPVDILIIPDGSMLISDDYSGRIYRVSY